MGQATIGISTALVALATATPDFRLGSVAGYDDPDNGYQEFLYVQTSEAVTAAGYLCVVKSGHVAEMLDATSSAPGAGQGMRVGAAMAAIESGGYGWLQIYGKGSARTLASAAAATQLTSSATPGAVDDATTAGLEVIDGLTLGTATGGAAATNTDAYFSYPVVGRTL